MIYTYLCFFFIYAFLGWCGEVSFAALKSGKFVNRGFLNGPLCPLYGVGAVLVVGFLTPYKDNFVILFIFGSLITTIEEWITGYILEKAFHQKWWDYTSMPLNISGYICPLFSVIWGLGCLLLIDVFHPTIAFFVSMIPGMIGMILLIVSSIVSMIDLCATVSSVLKLNKRLKQLDEMASLIRDSSNEIGLNLAESVIDMAEKSEDMQSNIERGKAEIITKTHEISVERQEALNTKKQELIQTAEQKRKELENARKEFKKLTEEVTKGQSRIMRAFPQIKSIDYEESMRELKKYIKDNDEQLHRNIKRYR